MTLWKNFFCKRSFTNKQTLYGLIVPPSFLFFPSFYFPFLSLSSLPPYRGWQLTVCSSPVTVYKPRGDEDNYYFKEWEEVREIWVQVMDTSDRYCHPEGTSKRHLIFTYQQQPYPTGKHTNPSQNPPFNCFKLPMQCCLSPPKSLRVPMPCTCFQAPKFYIQRWNTMPKWLKKTYLLMSQWRQGPWDFSMEVAGGRWIPPKIWHWVWFKLQVGINTGRQRSQIYCP